MDRLEAGQTRAAAAAAAATLRGQLKYPAGAARRTHVLVCGAVNSGVRR